MHTLLQRTDVRLKDHKEPSAPFSVIPPYINIESWKMSTETYCVKVAQNSFQYFSRLRVWWVIITFLYRLMPQSWYQNTAQSSVNKLLLILWHKNELDDPGHFLLSNRPFSKMAAENLNKSKLKTNTSTRKSTLTLVTLPSFSFSGEITAEKM